MTIEEKWFGCHKEGYDVYDGWVWVAWFPTLKDALRAYPDAGISSPYLEVRT